MDIVLRATVIFLALYILVRLMGKRELGQMTPFELIVLVVIGDLIQQGVTQNDFSLTAAIIAISTIAFWALVMSWASYLWPRAERLLEGEPRVIVRDGEVLEGNLRRDRLTRSEIESEMRLAGISRLADVAWAIVEPRGKISFISRAPDGADDLAFATDLARRAGTILLDSYERIERIDYKSKRDVVTDADYASERLVIDAIKARHPGDAILAEESGEHAGVVRDDGSRNGRTWVIDPLDGTVNYANGIPFYCVSIGLVVDDRPAVGVVLDPARDDLYTATADGPACLDGEPVVASTKESLSDYVVSLAVIGRGGLSRERRIAPQIRIHRRMGSAALALAYVANGRFDAFVQNGGLSPWDVAAAGLIAERAGAVVTHLRGGPWWTPKLAGARANIVAAPPAQHAALLDVLRALKTTAQTRR